MLTLDQFHYDLPDELIAQRPAVPRDHSKLLVVDRFTQNIAHYHFYDLPKFLNENDVLIRNNTKVIPARIFGEKATGGAVELLLIKRIGIGSRGEQWEVLSKPGIKLDTELRFENSKLTAVCREIDGYTRVIEFDKVGGELFAEFIRIGHTPLPPYIAWDDADETKLRELYQTVYARVDGSAAAPTAGLHFTHELDEKLRAKGVEIIEVTLHVGLGTFLPVKVESIETHHMHSEWCEVQPEVADKLNALKRLGKRMIAVGTTTVRTLESAVDEAGVIQPFSGETSIFIYPPYRFKFVDAMISNFHLPESTLLMLMSAFTTFPQATDRFSDFQSSLIGKAYQEAIEHQYRFFSFGDGMLIS